MSNPWIEVEKYRRSMHLTLHQVGGRVYVPPKGTQCEIGISQPEECFTLCPSAAYALVIIR